MSFVSEFLAMVAGLPRPLLILVTGALVLGECTIGLGFLVPGESGLLVASAAVTDIGFFFGLSLTVAACAVVGDNIGYFLGRRYGARVRETRMVAKLGVRHWDRACRMLRKYGIGAVFVARFLPVVRTLVPVSAGTSGLGYWRFLATSVVGATTWSMLHVGIGWAAGTSAKYIEHVLGRASGIVLGALVLIGIGVWLWRRRSKKLKAASAQPTDVAEEPVDAERAA
ncbi:MULTISPECIES: DedA family protein [unclassified Saccharopolyspora]|uniref:DedA family protein n=1 Tax=unclassified Saccharopolyspora TaxID=2646250 RepID=UPI001CD217C9|nr:MULTISPECIES: DedA family protein [unclassified Saccharopolyspora]MCA1189311.1 DedA family protein [Saccharopolyspora sp. 6T]MCA1195299.1 DedA family protein [Saccharopolyspora sp. 6V]MCA1229125.1 DedA family protein [Saccharopolyspora sp. 6M]MCA1283009.1 DedA family protein [Saccharopolyspora sp. 7B]